MAGLRRKLRSRRLARVRTMRRRWRYVHMAALVAAILIAAAAAAAWLTPVVADMAHPARLWTLPDAGLAPRDRVN